MSGRSRGAALSDNLARMTAGKLLGLRAVAERAGLAYSTLRQYHGDAQVRRRGGVSRPGDLPAPDEPIPGRPLWREETIDAWLASRPGQGKGGGRPWPARTEDQN